ncbi:MAG: hypothetical protein Terrestrivirus5_162 [Terrestrivirus sp.]|uniref:phenylalanine--tRNA ligase n=1 Tax=Terrestrivirus sp. TaxID=2487775 RepID=A0A3G4ZN70_9VIRU|nr:MAG: hypothetical protein Terrestrivirus5_162 [Terrestrivirus sp.]
MAESNIPESIKLKLDKKLHNKSNHPLKIIKDVIYDHFDKNTNLKMETFDNLPNVSSTVDNFDLLLIPKNHVSRSRSDTYYLDDNNVLRTHTSAHQNELLSRGKRTFLVTGDVYRKDEIDRFHYPVFHQMEGVNVQFETIEEAETDLKNTLGGLVQYLFPGKEYRFNKDYFPFTEPSFEIEVKFFDDKDKWVEILGCGVIHKDILKHNNIQQYGWAFGLGLERLAMILFSIPDIRLFWTNDERFSDQFNNINIENFRQTQYKQYPKLDKLDRDISFWIDESQIDFTTSSSDSFYWTNINDFYEIVREISGDDVELVTLYDKFFSKKLNVNKYSHTFRLTYSPNNNMKDPAEFTKKCNEQMVKLREFVQEKLSIKLR